MWHSQRVALAAIMALATVVASTTELGAPLRMLECCVAQEIDWISLDGSPPDTPATIEFDVEASDAESSWFWIYLPGFWVETRQGPDQRTYHALDFPGLGRVNQLGAPQLPAIRLDLAIPTSATEVAVEALQPVAVEYLPDFLVWPQEIPARENEDPIPPVFTLDEEVYGEVDFWPRDVASPIVRVAPRLGTIPHARATLNPCRWDPATGELEILSHFRIQFFHPGGLMDFEPISKDRHALASHVFDNWPAVRDHFPPDEVKLHASYLFVYDAAHHAALLPLINQKKARGYHVTLRTLDQIGSTCAAVSNAIAVWYNQSPASVDYYALLVGDTDRIPQCESNLTTFGERLPTDDLYGYVSTGDPLAEQVWVGRLSVDDATDLSNQVQKILAYENGASPGAGYDEVCAVQHKQSLGTVSGVSPSVWSTYAEPPTTHLHQGSLGASNADVQADINAGVGLVIYRGIAIESGWICWNTACESFDSFDINSLSNGPRTPVVWSIGPRMGNLSYNNNVGGSDCMGEVWMEAADGAVAHYGAPRMPYVYPSSILLAELAKAFFDEGVTIHSHLIALAENRLVKKLSNDNAWLYYLLGDPEMRIRRGAIAIWSVERPSTFPLCLYGPCDFDLRVTNAQSAAVSGALVSVWKPSSNGEQEDEVLDNRYTDENGFVQIPVETASEGWIHWVVRDDQGNAYVDSTQVVAGTAAPTPLSAQVRLRAKPSVLRSATSFDFGVPLPNATTLALYDVRGRVVRRLVVAAGSSDVHWDVRDEWGARVARGTYVARADVGGRAFTTRVVVLR